MKVLKGLKYLLRAIVNSVKESIKCSLNLIFKKKKKAKGIWGNPWFVPGFFLWLMMVTLSGAAFEKTWLSPALHPWTCTTLDHRQAEQFVNSWTSTDTLLSPPSKLRPVFRDGGSRFRIRFSVAAENTVNNKAGHRKRGFFHLGIWKHFANN